MAICKSCNEQCNLVKHDEGIGSYEFWGSKGVDSRIVIVSNCCHEEYELEPGETEEDHFEPDYDDY